MNLLKDAGLMKTGSDIGPFYEKLIKDFIVNLSSECNVEGRKAYMKFCISGKCVKFSPSIINEHLGRSKSTGSEKVPSIDKTAKEIIAGKVKQWPKKCLLPS